MRTLDKSLDDEEEDQEDALGPSFMKLASSMLGGEQEANEDPPDESGIEVPHTRSACTVWTLVPGSAMGPFTLCCTL